jgi:hypothetical protein
MKKYVLPFLFLLPMLIFAANASYQQLYDNYFALSNALAHDSVGDAKKAAKGMSTTVASLLERRSQKEPSVAAQDLPRDEAETVRQSLATAANLSKTIAAVDKLDQKRKPFEELTAVVAGLQPHTKIQSDEYYCPMVKKTWLQSKKSKEVLNPYAGKTMRSCGEKKKGK